MLELYVTTSEFTELRGNRIESNVLLVKKKERYYTLEGDLVCDVESFNGITNVKLHEEGVISEDF